MKEIFSLFTECFFDEENNCIVAIFPYTETLPATEGYAKISNYYITSNHAYHLMRRVVMSLKESGIVAKVDHKLPARSIAVKNGGFVGNNGFYFHPKYGSYVYIGIMSVLRDEQNALREYFSGFPRKSSSKNSCLGCGDCKKVCPTGALEKQDMSLCIREHVLKTPIPNEIASYIYQLYGCERCQLCCPENNIEYNKPVEFSLDELQEGGHFEQIRELVGKNIAKRDNVIEQAQIIKTLGAAQTRLGTSRV